MGNGGHIDDSWRVYELGAVKGDGLTPSNAAKPTKGAIPPLKEIVGRQKKNYWKNNRQQTEIEKLQKAIILTCQLTKVSLLTLLCSTRSLLTSSLTAIIFSLLNSIHCFVEFLLKMLQSFHLVSFRRRQCGCAQLIAASWHLFSSSPPLPHADPSSCMVRTRTENSFFIQSI